MDKSTVLFLVVLILAVGVGAGGIIKCQQCIDCPPNGNGIVQTIQCPSNYVCYKDVIHQFQITRDGNSTVVRNRTSRFAIENKNKTVIKKNCEKIKEIRMQTGWKISGRVNICGDADEVSGPGSFGTRCVCNYDLCNFATSFKKQFNSGIFVFLAVVFVKMVEFELFMF